MFYTWLDRLLHIKDKSSTNDYIVYAIMHDYLHRIDNLNTKILTLSVIITGCIKDYLKDMSLLALCKGNH